jgi:hypothetical protein
MIQGRLNRATRLARIAFAVQRETAAGDAARNRYSIADRKGSHARDFAGRLESGTCTRWMACEMTTPSSLEQVQYDREEKKPGNTAQRALVRT